MPSAPGSGQNGSGAVTCWGHDHARVTHTTRTIHTRDRRGTATSTTKRLRHRSPRSNEPLARYDYEHRRVGRIPRAPDGGARDMFVFLFSFPHLLPFVSRLPSSASRRRRSVSRELSVLLRRVPVSRRGGGGTARDLSSGIGIQPFLPLEERSQHGPGGGRRSYETGSLGRRSYLHVNDGTAASWLVIGFRLPAPLRATSTPTFVGSAGDIDVSRSIACRRYRAVLFGGSKTDAGDVLCRTASRRTAWENGGAYRSMDSRDIPWLTGLRLKETVGKSGERDNFRNEG